MKNPVWFLLILLMLGCGDDPASTRAPSTPHGLWSASNVQVSIEASGAWTAQVSQRNCSGGRRYPGFTASGFLQAIDGNIIHYVSGSQACNGGVYHRVDATFNSSTDELTINGAEVINCTSCGVAFGGNATRVQ